MIMWELVGITNALHTWRMRTTLGWIVLTEKEYQDTHPITQCFVPDPFHWWKLPNTEDGGES